MRAATIPAVLLSLVAAFCLTAALGACRRQPEERAPALDLAPPLAAPPQRIVPATAAAAELVADLVDPARVAALPEQVDSFATRDFSTGALGARPRFPRYLAEPVLSARPDLVITHSWQSQDTTALLRAQGVPVLVLRSGTDYAEVRATLLELGRVLGAEARATALVDGLDRRVARLREHAAARPRRRALVYTNDGTGGFAAGARTTAAAVLELAGLANAAAEDGVTGHQPVDLERVLRIDPDLFVVGTPARGEGGSATEALLLSSAPLSGLRAVRERRIAAIPGVLLSADSPAIVDAAEALERELARVFAEGR